MTETRRERWEHAAEWPLTAASLTWRRRDPARPRPDPELAAEVAALRRALGDRDRPGDRFPAG